MGIKRGALTFVHHRMSWKLGSPEAHLACAYKFDKIYSYKETLPLS